MQKELEEVRNRINWSVDYTAKALAELKVLYYHDGRA